MLKNKYLSNILFPVCQAWENYKPDGDRCSIKEGVITEKAEQDILNTKEASKWLSL
jgi:hypothetical protein